MLHYKITRTVVFLSLIAIVGTANGSANERTQVQKFFNSFCVACHGMETAEADLRLDQMGLQQWRDSELLEDIYMVIERGEMPPEDAPQYPESRQLQALQKVLDRQLHVLTETEKPGMLKRLSRVEYQNTVNDVFDTTFSLSDRLPLDNIDAGFNNNADNLHMSVVDMETYFNVANMIAETVVSDKPNPRVVVYSTKNTDIDSLSHKDNTNGFAPVLERDSRPLVFASPATQIKINPAVKTSGLYRIVPQGFYIRAEFVPGSREQERLPAVKNLSDRGVDAQPTVGHSMSYFLRKNAGAGQSIVTVIPNNAAWQDFDPREGFTTRLASDDTIVLRCNSVKAGGSQPMLSLIHI